jgi:N-acyl-phosphatidylethanolamine-hydrolysing phospholipase D
MTQSLLRKSNVISVMLSMLMLSGCSSASSLDKRPAHHTENGFQNIYIEDPDKGFFDFVKMRFFGEEWIDPTTEADQIPWQPLDLGKINSPSTAPQISWLGHSTFLIQYQGINILTDPAFADRVSPFSFAGPKRYTKHTIDYTQLPRIDYVVISHNHYDHLDAQATSILKNQTTPPTYFVPLGLKQWLVEKGIPALSIHEMDWYESKTDTKLKVDAYPSQHWSARGLFDRFETLWASWRLELGGFSLWFAGDTGYNEQLFTELGENMPAVDVSLIPIGAYAPRSFMKTYHTNPEESVLIHRLIKTKTSIGMHWGTYPLTAEAPTEPPIKLKEAIQKYQLNKDDFIVMTLGETLLINMDK